MRNRGLASAPSGGASRHLTGDLFRRYAPFVTRFLSRQGVPSYLVEDALQDVFEVVLTRGDYQVGAAKPTSYLGRVASFVALAYRRRERRRQARWSEFPLELLESAAGDPEQALETRVRLRDLQHGLDALPEALRNALLLVDLQGESGTVIAENLGLPVGTVYWRVHEARKRMRAQCSTKSSV